MSRYSSKGGQRNKERRTNDKYKEKNGSRKWTEESYGQPTCISKIQKMWRLQKIKGKSRRNGIQYEKIEYANSWGLSP